KLSFPPAHASKNRIAELLELLQETERCEGALFEDLLSRMPKWYRDSEIQYMHDLQAVETSPEQEAYTAVIGRGNRILRRYRSIPVLHPAVFELDELRGLRFYWEPERNNSKWRRWENEAARLILGLIEARELHRLHKCRNCSKWFYTVTDHQSHCSDNC